MILGREALCSVGRLRTLCAKKCQCSARKISFQVLGNFYRDDFSEGVGVGISSAAVVTLRNWQTFVDRAKNVPRCMHNATITAKTMRIT